MVTGADIPGRGDRGACRSGTGSEVRDGRTEEGSPRRLAEALRGKGAVDAGRHPDGWMRARARRLIRKAKAAGDDGPGSQFRADGSPGAADGA